MEYDRGTRFSSVIAALIVVAASFGAGYVVAVKHPPAIERVVTLSAKEEGKPQAVDFSPFWKTWNVLDERFVGATTSDQVKVWGAISGLANSLGDPYTVFMPPDEAKIFETEISGNFEGVGMEIGIKDGTITVVAPLKGTPAARAGLLPADKIIKINETLTAGMKVEGAVKLIRGPRGTDVRLTIIREGRRQPFEIKVTRDVITVPTIDTEFKSSATTTAAGGEEGETGLRSGGIFVIKLYNFSALSPGLFRDALRQFISSGSHKLIIDLRGNPGGYLEAAVDIASWFLPAGEVVVKEDAGREEGRVYRSRGYNVFNKTLRLVILVNNGSASASEILAGALSEHGVGTLVGTKTFGKGSVQELVKVTPDTALKVTIARWLTPNGRSISEGGLTPDIVVPLSPDDVEKGRDPQMDRAIRILQKEK